MNCEMKNCSIAFAQNGLTLKSTTLTIDNVTISNCSGSGICIKNAGANLIGTEIYSCETGISVTAPTGSSNALLTVERCHIHNNTKHGIDIYIKVDNTYTGNWIANCNMEIYDSILEYNRGVGVNLTAIATAHFWHQYAGVNIDTEMENTIISHNQHGIYTYCHQGSYANADYCLSTTACIFSHQGKGILLDHAEGAIIVMCNFTDNTQGIYVLANSNGNIFHHNNFFNNTNQSHDEGSNLWDDGSEGNYWSDFDEASEGAYDNNSDGIADSPYNILGGSNKDWYPLMEPCVADTTPPDTYITSCPSGYMNISTAIINWTGSDDQTPTGDLTYSYRLDNWSSTWSPWTSTSTITYPSLPDGRYTFYVKTRDASGNIDATPASESFTVDTTPPVIKYTGLHHMELICNNAVLNANVTDASPLTDIRCEVDDQRYNFTTENGSKYLFSVYDSTIGRGMHTMTIVAQDIAGHTARVAFNVTMANLEVVPAVPTDTDEITMNLRLPEAGVNNSQLQLLIAGTWQNNSLAKVKNNTFSTTIGPYAPLQNITYRLTNHDYNGCTYISEHKTLAIRPSDLFGPSITMYTINPNVTRQDNVTIRALITDESGVKPTPSISYSTDEGDTYTTLTMTHGIHGYYEATIGPFPDTTSSVIYYSIHAIDVYNNHAWHNDSFPLDTGRPHIVSNFAEPVVNGSVSISDGWQPYTVPTELYSYVMGNVTFTGSHNITLAFTRNDSCLYGLITMNASIMNLQAMRVLFDHGNDYRLNEGVDRGIQFTFTNATMTTAALRYNGTAWREDPANASVITSAYTCNGDAIIEFTRVLYSGEMDATNMTKMMIYMEGMADGGTDPCFLLWPPANDTGSRPSTYADVLNIMGGNGHINGPVRWGECQVSNHIWIISHNLSTLPSISAGETFPFNFSFHTLSGVNITDVATLNQLTFTLYGPGNESRNATLNQHVRYFTYNFTTNYTEEQGYWEARIIVEDEHGNMGTGMLSFLILDVYQVQVYQNHDTYISGENMTFHALISTYGNQERYLNESSVTVTVSIISPGYNTIESCKMGYDVFHNQSAFTCSFNTTNYSLGTYTVVFIVEDAFGNTMKLNSTITIISNVIVTVATDKDVYVRGEQVNITGAVYVDGQPLNDAMVYLEVKLRKVTYHAYSETNSTGCYQYSFDTSNIYLGHCNINASVQWNNRMANNFTSAVIHGLYVTPAGDKTIWLPTNYSYTATYLLYNVGETNLTALALNITEGNVSNGITIQASGVPLSLRPGERAPVNITLTTVNASGHATFTLRFINEQYTNETRNINVNILTPTPRLIITPQKIAFNMAPGAHITQPIKITNIGYAPAENISVIPPTHAWIHITATHLGNLISGNSIAVDVNLQPPSTLSEGYYNDSIYIVTDNSGTYVIPINIQLTTLLAGGLRYTISNDLGHNVTNAHITVTKEHDALYYTNTTNANGVAAFTTLQPGKYTFTIAAAGHETLKGCVIVEPGVIKQLNILQYTSFIEYQWKVKPITVEDQYYLTLEMEYNPDFHAPVLVSMPSYLQFDVVRSDVVHYGYGNMVYVKICNYGNAPAYNVTITSYRDAGYNITPLLLEPVIPVI
ncbi:MAG: NosD domain-containing protein, partial [Thermoplasmatota archaeon]